jgi:hypothetical protein
VPKARVDFASNETKRVAPLDEAWPSATKTHPSEGTIKAGQLINTLPKRFQRFGANSDEKALKAIE